MRLPGNLVAGFFTYVLIVKGAAPLVAPLRSVLRCERACSEELGERNGRNLLHELAAFTLRSAARNMLEAFEFLAASHTFVIVDRHYTTTLKP